MIRSIAALPVLLLLASPLYAQGDGPETGPALAAGAAVTVGSHDYSGMKFSGDAAWKLQDLGPFARADIMFDDFQRSVTLGGGVWKSMNNGVDVKGGLALTSARFKDTDESGSSI